ncbi:hypothetical protein M0812_09711 [Anaeramoeba flamelloides]|uniref:BTB domain-containing protein n=1 Tax=Anaeramoeba flamelloides TaxID=1746091 RepID=A0AAV7ZTS1_9EUKA|nr:hypothetical protein M0812_09711 [Anaeramoeba flamelloides]
MYEIKLVIVGDSSVGKTSMLISYTTNAFPGEYLPRTYDNTLIDVKLEQELVSLSLWDTVGNQEYDRLRPLSYCDTDAFLICFDIAFPTTFKNVKTRWIKEVQEHCPGIPVFLVGNKLDLREDQTIIRILEERGESPITCEQGMQMAKEIGAIKYLEHSAKTQQGLKQVFEEPMKFARNFGLKIKVKKVGGLFKSPKLKTLEPLQFSSVSSSYFKEINKMLSIDPSDELEQENPKVYGSDIHFLWLEDQPRSSIVNASDSEASTDIRNEEEQEKEEENSQNSKVIKKEIQIEIEIEKTKESESKKEKKENEKEKKENELKKEKKETLNYRHIINTNEMILRARCPIFQKILNKDIDSKEIEKKLGTKSLGDGKYQMKRLKFSSFVLYLKYLFCEPLESLLSIDADRLFELKEIATKFENKNCIKLCEWLNENLMSLTNKDNIVSTYDQKIKRLIKTESHKLFKFLENEFQKRGKKYNDLILNIEYNKENKKILINKSILIARTNYFKDLIKKQFRTKPTPKSSDCSNNKKKKDQKKNKNKNKDISEINVNIGFKPSLFSDLKKFLYTNEIKFKNYRHCVDLLSLAKYISQDTLIGFCQIAIVDKFIPKVSNKDLLNLYSLLKPFEFKDLEKLIVYFMGYNKKKIKNLKQYQKIFNQKERESFESIYYYSNKSYFWLQTFFQRKIIKDFGLEIIEISNLNNDK